MLRRRLHSTVGAEEPRRATMAKGGVTFNEWSTWMCAVSGPNAQPRPEPSDHLSFYIYKEQPEHSLSCGSTGSDLRGKAFLASFAFGFAYQAVLSPSNAVPSCKAPLSPTTGARLILRQGLRQAPSKPQPCWC